MKLPFTRQKEQKARIDGSDATEIVALSPAEARLARQRTRKKRNWVRPLVLVTLLLAAGGGVYFWQVQANTKAAEPTISLPVSQGDLSVTVESNGNVQATSQSEVKYETTGQVVEVLVKQGDHVDAGQPLVRLSDHDQKMALSEAQAALDTAQAKLDDLKAGSSAADIESAQADLQAAEAELQGVQAGATAKDIADAEADVRAAQASLDTVKAGATPKQIADANAQLKAAQANLDMVKSGATPKEIADAEAQLKSAQSNLDSVKAGATTKQIKDAEADLQTAQAALAQLKEPATASEIKAAESDVASAKAKLADLKKGPTAAELSEKQSAVTQASTDLQKIRNDAALAKSKAELALAKADRDLEEAQRNYGKVADELLNENGDLTVDASDPRYSQYWEVFNALKDAEADQTAALAELENVRQNEIANVDQGQAALDNANKQLTDLQAGATASELADAQAAVDTAQKALDDLKKGPSTSELASANADVTKAQTTLDELKAGAKPEDIADAEAEVTKAQSALDELKAGPTQDKIATAEADVTEAQTKVDELKAGPTKSDLADAQSAVDKAQNNLKDLKAGPSQADIAAAQAKVAQQKAALQKAQEPATSSEIAAANESVVQAQKSLAEAQTDVDKTVLHAPFSGIVASVDAEANSTIAVGDTAVELYNPEGMYLDINVSEADIEQVKVGQEVAITVDAVANQVITGTVSSVSPVATSGQDVVNYKVKVTFDPKDLPVKVGMSANAAITVQTKKGVMQVPNRAISNDGPYKAIKLMYTGKDGKATPVTVHVTTGITDGFMTEILGCVDTQNQCLRTGDQVAMTIPTATNDSVGSGPGNFTFSAGPAEGGATGGPMVVQIGPGPGPGKP